MWRRLRLRLPGPRHAAAGLPGGAGAPVLARKSAAGCFCLVRCRHWLQGEYDVADHCRHVTGMASKLLDVSRSFPSSAQDQAQNLPSGAVCRLSSASQKRDCAEQPLPPQALLPKHLHRRARGRRGGGAGRVSGEGRPQASGLLAVSGDVGAAGRKQLFGQSTRGRHTLGAAAANIVVVVRTRRGSADAGCRRRFVSFRRRAARTVGHTTSGLAGGRCGRCCRVGRAGASAAAARRGVAAI
mmetsp:Transcript_28719/g.73685  ORF Transcript_28719/g.73685 Transcript_28719/m.73685 type:complete len:241 (+) Transcript_28719:497-1219(+)